MNILSLLRKYKNQHIKPKHIYTHLSYNINNSIWCGSSNEWTWIKSICYVAMISTTSHTTLKFCLFSKIKERIIMRLFTTWHDQKEIRLSLIVRIIGTVSLDRKSPYITNFNCIWAKVAAGRPLLATQILDRLINAICRSPIR